MPSCLQPNEYIKTLADMKVTLKELCWLLRDERRGLTELQQQFAKAKATWETERAELKGHASQVSCPQVRRLFPRGLAFFLDSHSKGTRPRGEGRRARNWRRSVCVSQTHF